MEREPRPLLRAAARQRVCVAPDGRLRRSRPVRHLGERARVRRRLVSDERRAGLGALQDGYWTSVGGWGLTWVDAAPWGYAPFHYGRWAWVGGRWGWCPGAFVARPVWAPALVGWVGGAGWGVSARVGAPVYGWVPLGWGEPLHPWWQRCSYNCWARYNRPYAVNVAVRPTHPPAQFRNVAVPGAMSAVAAPTLSGRLQVREHLVTVPSQQYRSAPVLAAAPAVPSGPPRIPGPRAGTPGVPAPASTYYPVSRQGRLGVEAGTRQAQPGAASTAPMPGQAMPRAAGSPPPTPSPSGSPARGRPAPATAPARADPVAPGTASASAFRDDDARPAAATVRRTRIRAIDAARACGPGGAPPPPRGDPARQRSPQPPQPAAVPVPSAPPPTSMSRERAGTPIAGGAGQPRRAGGAAAGRRGRARAARSSASRRRACSARARRALRAGPVRRKGRRRAAAGKALGRDEREAAAAVDQLHAVAVRAPSAGSCTRRSVAGRCPS